MKYYVHVIGPGDVHECESLADALRLQADFLQSALELAEHGGEHMPATWANILSEEDYEALMKASKASNIVDGQD